VTIALDQPNADEMDEVLDTLREWQQDESHVLLHPGDLGWFWRLGGDAAASATRTWRRDGHLVAIGLLDEPFWLRVAIAPDLQQDEPLARQLAADVSDPDRGVLPMENVWFDVPRGALLRDLMSSLGWEATEAWTPLSRDLTDPVEAPGVRIETGEPAHMAERIAVQRASFEGSTFTDERWHAMTGGPAYADARCLLAYDEGGAAVATVTVWSAGPGRPGLLEPMGVHHKHRGHGYGRAISLAAAAALREMGSSSAIVCTPTSYEGAIATYEAAGFLRLPQRWDLHREVTPDPAGPSLNPLVSATLERCAAANGTER
jgi:predicted N-acetyltransferase YhbS